MATIVGPAGTLQTVEDFGVGVLATVRKPHVGALGVDDSSGLLRVQSANVGVLTTYLTADIDPAGQVVLTGPSIVYAVAINQASGGTLFAHLYDATTTQPTNTKPLTNAGTCPNNGTSILTVGHPVHGLPFSTGVVLQLSSVASQFSPSGATNARGYVIHT